MAVKRYGQVDTAPLARPLTFARSGRTAKNRLMKSSMAEYLADWSRDRSVEGGVPTDEHVELYRRWGKGGWGMILTGNIDVQHDALDAVGDMIISAEHEPEGPRFEKFREIAAAGTAEGGLIIGQLSHPGRQVGAHVNPVALSASDVQLAPTMGMEFGKPHAASEEEIAGVIRSFAHAAAYLDRAGFSGAQLHAAHGYLVSQFLSRRTNLRTDRYGAQTAENRLRLVTEIADAVRAAVSADFVVGVKLNSVEFSDGGVTPAEAAEVVRRLEDHGVDFVELSGGSYEQLVPDDAPGKKESTKLREAFYLEFVKTMTGAMGRGKGGGEGGGIKTYLVGGLRSASVMVEALDVVDGVGVARAAAAEPDLAGRLLDADPERRAPGAVVPAGEESLEQFRSMLLARVQMAQVARGQEPLAYGDAEAMAGFDFGAVARQVVGGAIRLEL